MSNTITVGRQLPTLYFLCKVKDQSAETVKNLGFSRNVRNVWNVRNVKNVKTLPDTKCHTFLEPQARADLNDYGNVINGRNVGNVRNVWNVKNVRNVKNVKTLPDTKCHTFMEPRA